MRPNSGRKKVSQRTFSTKISPNFRVNFLVRLPQNPCFICARNHPRAKFLRNFSKRSAKFWRNFSQISVLQFPGKMAAKNFTKNPRLFPRCTKLSFFTAATLGLGAQLFYWAVPSNCSCKLLVLFVRFFCLWGSFFFVLTNVMISGHTVLTSRDSYILVHLSGCEASTLRDNF